MRKIAISTSAAKAFVLLLTLAAQAPGAEKDYFVFRDVLAERGIDPIVNDPEFRAHAVAWGDVDGDGWIDLYVGTMGGQEPAAFFWNNKGHFTLMKDHPAAMLARATGSVMVDLDNDGLLELYISNHGGRQDDSVHSVPHLLFQARPGRTFERVTDSGATPCITGRGIGVMDYDGDGLLDLFLTSRPSGGQRSWLFHNLGGLKFEEASAKARLPLDIHGLGVAVADLTGNGWPDFIVGGSNRVFLNRGDGTFREATELKPLLDWNYAREDETDSCGVAFGDINRDGRPDLAVGFHTSWPWSTDPRPVRLFINKGCTVDRAAFQEVTAPAGLKPLWMKAPHVELRDFDNDGWPDLLTGVMVYAPDGRHHPLIYKHMATTPEGNALAPGGVPAFRQTALGHQPDFPTPPDKAISRPEFSNKVPTDPRVWYFPLGPSGDFDNDGRLDLFFSRGDPKTPSLLLKNETPGGNWLKVRVEGSNGLNRQGIGTVVGAYKSGHAGDPEALLYSEEIAVGYGYASGQPAIAHLGLGAVTECDLQVTFPHGRGMVTRRAVKANQLLVITK
jgi:hypothetical protein